MSATMRWLSHHTSELGVLYTVAQYVAAKTAFAGTCFWFTS